jgi:hypothetical protein
MASSPHRERPERYGMLFPMTERAMQVSQYTPLGHCSLDVAPPG